VPCEILYFIIRISYLKLPWFLGGITALEYRGRQFFSLTLDKVAPYAAIAGYSRTLCLYLVANKRLMKIMSPVSIRIASRALWLDPQLFTLIIHVAKPTVHYLMVSFRKE